MPSKRQVSMSLSPVATKAVDKRIRPGNTNRSRIVSQMIERYLGILRAHRLELEEDELEHLGRLTEGWSLDFSTAAALEGLVKVADVPEDLSVKKHTLLMKLVNGEMAGAVSALEQIESWRG